jgi:hypothetical protein
VIEEEHMAKRMVGVVTLLILGCDGGGTTVTPDAGRPPDSGVSGPPDTVPDLSKASFTDPLAIDNPWFPLVPGTTHVYFGEEKIIYQILDETYSIMGIETRVVRDRVYEDDVLVEDTRDWFAQDDEGNVWYMGETVDNYNYDDNGELIDITHEGAWEAGKDVANTGQIARPGYQMLAQPIVGRIYHQEYYPGEAEDAAEVLDLAAPVTTEAGLEFSTLKTRDFSTSEPTADERKYYGQGIGTVLETTGTGEVKVEYVGTFDEREPPPDFVAAAFTNPTVIDNPFFPLPIGSVRSYRKQTEDGLEEVLIEVLDETRIVAGVEAVVVRDRVTLDGELLEDTRDWYAQDDSGNVWYLGEVVDDYVYDDNGELIEITHPGQWEAGVEGAQAGIIMYAEPLAGDSYRQELRAGVAEDMAYVVGIDDEGVLTTLDWAPLEPHALEYKFYAPGVGLIREQALGSDEILEMVP